VPGLGTGDSGLGSFLSANGVLLHYEVEGDGPPLVLLHGWTLDLRMFDPQMPAFTREHRVIRMDRRGFGRSSDAEDTTWNASDLCALLDHLDVARAHILGMSQGGFVTLAFAAAYPDRVASFILHGSTPPSGFGVKWAGPDRYPLDLYRALAREQGLEAFRRVWLEHPLMRIPEGARHDEARERLRTMVEGYRGGYLLQLVDPSGPHKGASFEDVAKIQAPALVLTGDEEIPFLSISADAMAYAIRGARRAVVPGGGHLVNLIEPARYNETVLAFLRSAG
jgi:3-oxoadipate enol-lactonase